MTLEQSFNKAIEDFSRLESEVRDLHNTWRDKLSDIDPVDYDTMEPNPEYKSGVKKASSDIEKEYKKLEKKALALSKERGRLEREKMKVILGDSVAKLKESELERAYQEGVSFVMVSIYREMSKAYSTLSSLSGRIPDKGERNKLSEYHFNKSEEYKDLYKKYG